MDRTAIREYYNVIKNKISQNRFDAALNSINKVLSKNPHDEHAYYYKGVCLFALEKIDKAIESYVLAIQNEPTYAKAYFNLGICFYLLRKYDQALINIGKALIIFTKRRELEKKKRCIDALAVIEKERKV